MSAAHRVIAVVVAVLIVAGIIVFGLNVAGEDVAADVSQSPSISAVEPPSPSGAPTEEPSPDDADAVLAALAEIEDQVLAIRGLPAADIGPPELLSREELRAELLASFEEDYPADEAAEDNASLRALGLLDGDADIRELQLQLLGDQVLGFYDEVDKRLVVVTDAGLDPLAKFAYAHEYTHALQDAAYDLETLGIEEEGQDDRALARLAMVEGDATVAMLAWAIEHLSPAELAEITSQAPPDTSGIPSWLVERLVVFPYNEGLTWAGTLSGNPLSPDFTAIDAAFADPPSSTEQILDLEKWDPREEPVEVDVPDLATALGDGWSEVDDTPIGQAFLRMILEYHGIPREEAQAASAGWGGDRSVVAIGPDDAFAVAWRLAWDTPADAAEFVTAYRTAIAGFSFPASVTELDGGEVLVAHGSSEEILRRTVDAADD